MKIRKYTWEDFHVARGIATASLAFGIGYTVLGYLDHNEMVAASGAATITIWVFVMCYALGIYSLLKRREAAAEA